MKLSPCPFCQGPPVPFASSMRHGFKFSDETGDGVIVDAYVFCHECGAQGPHMDAFLYEPEEVPELVERAVAAWQERCAKHRGLYDAGDTKGLNEYPRLSV